MATGDMVIGVGSPHGDDRIGWRLIDHLAEDPSMAASLCAISDPVDLVQRLEGVRRLVIVDACRSGGRPGGITRLNWSDPLISSHHGHSTHRISLIDTLKLAQVLGRLPEQVILYGVNVVQCVPQTDLCPVVADALPDLARRIVAELTPDPQTDEDFCAAPLNLPDA